MSDRSAPPPSCTHSVQTCVAAVQGPDAGLDCKPENRRKRNAVMAEKIHHLWLMKLTLMLSIAAAAAVLQSQVGSEVSIAEIDKTLHAIDVDRTAASDGERAAAEYLDRKLAEYGVAHTKYEARLYLSWPGRASVTVAGLPAMNAKTAAFAAPTPPDGVAGALIVNPTLTRRVDQTLAFGPEVR